MTNQINKFFLLLFALTCYKAVRAQDTAQVFYYRYGINANFLHPVFGLEGSFEYRLNKDFSFLLTGGKYLSEDGGFTVNTTRMHLGKGPSLGISLRSYWYSFKKVKRNKSNPGFAEFQFKYRHTKYDHETIWLEDRGLIGGPASEDDPYNVESADQKILSFNALVGKQIYIKRFRVELICGIGIKSRTSDIKIHKAHGFHLHEIYTEPKAEKDIGQCFSFTLGLNFGIGLEKKSDNIYKANKETKLIKEKPPVQNLDTSYLHTRKGSGANNAFSLELGYLMDTDEPNTTGILYDHLFQQPFAVIGFTTGIGAVQAERDLRTCVDAGILWGSESLRGELGTRVLPFEDFSTAIKLGLRYQGLRPGVTFRFHVYPLMISYRTEIDFHWVTVGVGYAF